MNNSAIFNNPHFFKYILSDSQDPDTQKLLRILVEPYIKKRIKSAKVDPDFKNYLGTKATVRVDCITEDDENITVELILQ